MGWFGALRSQPLEVISDVTYEPMSPFDRAYNYDILFNFDRNYASVLYRFRDIASHFVEIR